MQEITTTRSNPLIDPSLHVWHGEVAAYLFLGGLVAGVMVLLGFSLLRKARDADGAAAPPRTRSLHLSLLPWSIPALLSVGMLFLWLDLENPFNAWRFYAVFIPTSPMSWGAWILLAIYPASLALAWTTTPQAVRESAQAWLGRRARRLIDGRAGTRAAALLGRGGAWVDANPARVGLANVIAGAALGLYTGLLLGTMAARPLWNSAILGPLFLASGLSTGAAYMLLFRLDDSERVAFSRLDMGFIAAELALIAVWLVGLLSSGGAHRAAGLALLGGPWTTAFWALVVGMGLLVPLAAEWMEHRGGHVPGRVAAVLVLAGGFALRWILVYAGQHVAWGESAVASLTH
jgi:formate-dependent nitrite reductase membrane component NrfD